MKNACEKAIDFRKTNRARDYYAYKEWFERKHPCELKRKPYDGR
jgi:hypothetical protein